MTSSPVPCPFCGAAWSTRDGYYIHGVVPTAGWDGSCPMLGAAMLPRAIDTYNRQVKGLAVIPYVVEDDEITFGRGDLLADADFINRVVSYYKGG